jgi:hypothetical protein
MFALPMLCYHSEILTGSVIVKQEGIQPEASKLYGREPDHANQAEYAIEARKAGAVAVISPTALRFALQPLRLCTR